MNSAIAGAAHLFQRRVDKVADVIWIDLWSIRLRRDDGEWVFLECNPNGQWAWFPDPIPGRIAAAIADHLQATRERI